MFSPTRRSECHFNTRFLLYCKGTHFFTILLVKYYPYFEFFKNTFIEDISSEKVAWGKKTSETGIPSLLCDPNRMTDV